MHAYYLEKKLCMHHKIDSAIELFNFFWVSKQVEINKKIV